MYAVWTNNSGTPIKCFKCNHWECSIRSLAELLTCSWIYGKWYCQKCQISSGVTGFSGNCQIVNLLKSVSVRLQFCIWSTWKLCLSSVTPHGIQELGQTSRPLLQHVYIFQNWASVAPIWKPWPIDLFSFLGME